MSTAKGIISVILVIPYINLALYDYNQDGGEFQVSSSENGTSRSWIDRDKILGKVTPFVQIL